MKLSRRRLSWALALAIVPGAAQASVSFQNEGTLTGWTNYPQNPCCGPINQVSSPTFQGSTAIRYEQTFTGFGSYHNEVTKSPSCAYGSDCYYGYTLYLPSTWIFHDQNITFTQWARSDSSNTPWTLQFVQLNEIRNGGSGGIRKTWGTIEKGVWNRFVTHIRNHDTQGTFEVWINGSYKGATSENGTVPGPVSPGPVDIRWSAGQYCTYWRENLPTGGNTVVSYMDHFRIATTYAEADPAGWGGTSPTPTPSPTPTAPPRATPTPTPTTPAGGTLSGYYRITPRHSGKAVAVQSASTVDGANVFQWSYGGSNTNDEWEARSIGSGYYRLIARHSGKDMTVQSASTAEGANIFQWPYGGSNTNDEWAIVDVGGGYRRITNRHSGKSAEVVGGGTGDGTNVAQRTYSGATHQQFQFVPVP
jgi:hypothetical protein